MASASRATRFALGIPTLALCGAWALWEFLQLRMPGSAELVGYDLVKVLFCVFASYIAWRVWRWVSGKDTHFGKTPEASKAAKAGE
jgi:hypothetical protein